MPPVLPQRLRALTLWPEWAWAIHHLDKRVENRTWALPVGEWFALHAGKSPGGKPTLEAACDADVAIRLMAQSAGWEVSTTPGNIRTSRVTFRRMGRRSVDWNVLDTPTSAIVGLFRVVRAEPPQTGDLGGWRVGAQVGNVFEYAPLAASIPCGGAQGLWTVPAEVAERVRAEVADG